MTKRLLISWLCILSVSIWAIAVPAFAGPQEDGVAAYERKDFAAALVFWQPLADAGNAEAQDRIGRLYANGEGVTQDQVKAAAWFRKSADQGNAEAEWRLAKYYFSGVGPLPKNVRLGLIWLQKSADQGFAAAEFALASEYGRLPDLPSDPEKALFWWRKAADQGMSEAMYQVAQTYSDGRGVPRDEAQAAIWFRKAAEKGNQGAQIGLGRLYAQGLGVGRDRDQALFWFRKAAAQEGMAARIAEQLIASLQTDSAPMLSNAPPDARQQAWNTALNNVRAEAKAGNAASQRTLGDFYSIRGFAGSTDDAQQAMAWWRKAADQGDTRAMDKLAVAYLLGKFVPRDAGQSASWTRKAAEKDDPLAELQFSRDYAAGIGVPNDKVQAIFWFRKADAHGGLFHDWAKSSLAGLNRPIQPLTPTPK